ncbi:MAG: NAD-dependent epimerase/dehydratase family protein [Bacteroidales bacterium]|nr:NAD-dependent epimerase/dehydratase family protein [Bacteroidales bacterium]MCF8397113.1 NAD-dependent epimerase/dehydratase family protein [Bacteroidales bacterium]
MIFVSGGTGLVGSHLLYYLSRSGEKIKALKRKNSDTSRVKYVFSLYDENPGQLYDKIQWVEGDVLDYFSLENAIDEKDKVFHCAAIVSFHPSRHAQMMKVNVNGTSNLVNACLQKKAEKLCFISSIAALGRNSDGEEIDENTAWKTSRNNSAYAVSKYNAEREVWRGAAEGLKTVIVNPSVILGPGKWNIGSAQLFEQVWKGLRFYTNGINGFVDVRDVGRIMIRLMESDIVNERFIVNAENISYEFLFTEMAKALKKKPPNIRVNTLISEIAWRIEKLKFYLTGKQPLITKETARTANARYYYSTQKLLNTIDYQYIPARKSVRDTAEIFLNEHINQ